MPDEIQPPAAVTHAAPATPTPAAAPDSGKTGIAKAMEELDAGVAAIEKTGKEAPAAKPAEKSAESKPKPEAKPEAKADEKAESEPKWDSAPKNLRNSHFKFKREAEDKISKYEARVKELEAKSNQSPADLQKIKDYEARISEMEQSLGERETALIESNYARSAEFKRDYIDTAAAAYRDAVDEIKNLTVSFTDPKTEEQVERAATEADFRALLKMEPREQDKKIDELFGASSKRVMLHIAELKRIEKQGNAAITKAKEKSLEKQRMDGEQQVRRTSEFKDAERVAQEELLRLQPEYFAPDESNPEATKALENGLKFFDDTVNSHGKFTPQQLAERAVVTRYCAGAYPRLVLLDKANKAKIAGLEAELAKYRKSSPDNDGSQGGVAAPAAKSEGISAAAKMFDGLKD